MQLKELLELRKQGKYEEAYNGISEIYAHTRNRYTALAMFWGADDLFKLRMRQKRTDECRRLLYDMVKAYPLIEDNDLRANRKIVRNALTLDKALLNFKLTYFLPYFFRLSRDDWRGIPSKDYIVPSLDQQVTNRLMANIAHADDAYIQQVLPFFRTALSINPTNKDNTRHLARLYVRVSLKQQAIKLYQRLLRQYTDSYLYAELAELVDGSDRKIALLTQAIAHQKDELYSIKWRYQLAMLLQPIKPEHAAYEIRKSIAIREEHLQPIPSEVDRVYRILQDYTPVTEADEQKFYRLNEPLADRIIAEA